MFSGLGEEGDMLEAIEEIVVEVVEEDIFIKEIEEITTSQPTIKYQY